MRVVFSNRAYASILAETTEKIKTETGGLFLGKCIDDVWYVVEAIDPGPKSIFEVAYFEYDQKYTQHLINKIANLYEEKLELIGLWHRHPGSMDFFSSTDDGTNSKYASMNSKGAISGLVNIDPKFRLTMYQVDRPCKYSVIKYDIGDELIPRELMELKSIQRFEAIMDNMLGRANENGTVRSASLKYFMKKVIPYLWENKQNAEEFELFPQEEAIDSIIDNFYDDITFMGEKLGIMLSLKNEKFGIGLVQETVDGTEIVYCYKDKDTEKYLFEYNDDMYMYESSLFENAFKKYVADENAKKNIETHRSSLFDSMLRKVINGRSVDE